MLQEKNAFVSLFSWLYANFIVTNSGNAGYMIHGRLLRLPELFYLKIKQAMLCLDISNEVKNLYG